MSTAVHHSMEGWPKYRLRFLLNKTRSEDELSKLEMAQEVSFVPMEAIGEQGEMDVTQTKPKEEVSNGYTLFFDGDVLVAKITPCFENGKGAVARGLAGGIGFGTTELYVLDPSDKLYEQYLYYLTVSEPFRKFGEASMKGAAGQKRVPDEFIQDYRLDLPPLETQRRIADYLDRETARIDALVAEKEKMLALLEEKRTALISRAVTRGLDPNAPLKPSGLDWLGDIPAHWDVLEIKRGFGLIGSGTTPPTNEEEWYQGDVLWVTTSELRETVVNDTQKKLSADALESFPALRIYPKGSLMVAMYGATIGRVGLLGMEATVNQAVCVLANGLKLKEEYVFFLLQLARPYLVSYATGGGQPNLNAEKIRDFKVPCPPMVEQSDIDYYLKDVMKSVDVAVAAISESISLLKERRSALITAAVTGQISVGAD